MASVLEEKEAIRELSARYFFHVDNAEFGQWLALWTDDALFVVDGREIRGRAGLEQFTREIRLVNGKPAFKHLGMNQIITVDGDTATSTSYLLTVFKRKDGALAPVTAGVYEDRLVKRDGQWLFAERRLRGDLRAG